MYIIYVSLQLDLFASGNIKILSKFPPNSESFDAKQLDDTRILILRVLLGVCHTCCDEKSDLEV